MTTTSSSAAKRARRTRARCASKARTMWCGLATVTSASRMIFAFSRDGGLPFSKLLAKVSPTRRTPVAAIWTGAT
ncbi:amino acid permease, partial [Parvibaculum sp.]|uniref:amino acid permease n=1 Tax=Parvibaculum sp. TaxID=2024848 RepID=UPI0039C8F8E4